MNAEIAGDTRFDRVLEISASTPELSLIDIFAKNNVLMVAGSTWPQDEKLVFELSISSIASAYKFIIAPHDIAQVRISQLIKLFGSKAVLFSNLSEENARISRVLIMDNIGLLASLYRYGQMAFIGGGFGKGVHNILEAAVFGIPVFFGPKHEKSREALQLKELNCAFSIKTSADLKAGFLKFDERASLRDQIKLDISAYFRRESGSTGKILEKMKDFGF